MKQAVLIALLGCSSVSAWKESGHVIIANIAYHILRTESPKTVTQVEDVLSILKKSHPSITPKEKDYPIVESCSYADDIKYHGGMYQ